MEQNPQTTSPDILKCKQDILRAKQAVTKNQSANNIQNEEKKTTEAQRPAAPTALMAAVVEANKKQTAPRQEGIPRFDLAEQIMAQQRKIVSARRKPPADKTDSQSQTDEISIPFIGAIRGESACSNQIIAEIVARDINLLARPN